MKNRNWHAYGRFHGRGRNTVGRSRRSRGICLGMERLEPRQLLSAQPVITEFLARNDGGLRDANGRSSDWIEIFNAGDAPIDLQGYHLTDDAGRPDQWTFPSVVLDPGGFLVVFASGQEGSDVVDADGNLHTNFTLTRGGDYIALVAPDNAILSEYGSGGQDFPEQVTNVSYGVSQSATLIDAGSASTYLIPGHGNVDNVWTDRDFDALSNGFTPGTASLGFETRPDDRNNFNGQFETAISESAHAVYTRIDFDLGDASAVANLALRVKYDNGFIAYLNGVKVAEENAPPNPSWFSVAPEAPRRDTEAVESVTFDISQHVDALVDGKNVLALHGLNNADDVSDMLLVTELVAGASDPEAAFGTAARTGYLAIPTPGAPNPSPDHVFSGFVEDTKFTVDRGFYDAPQQVEITTETPGAVIRYTTDGSSPRPDNPTASVYTGSVTIDSTTTLRAAAFRDDFLPTNVDTHTYVFLSDVMTQDFQAALDAGFPDVWGRTPAEYGLDPKVIGPDDLFDGKFAGQLLDSLTAAPSISIVTGFENLFGPTGILENTSRGGIDWERPTSVELIHPDGTDGFQIDAGIRIQGDASRDYSNSKKMSFRFAFRSQYGDTQLAYPLFGENAATEFDTIRLRANYNDGSVHTPRSTQQIRDEWMRRTLLDMGQPNAHGTFMHVYLNGMYWGLYNVVERPDESFSASYFGGDKDNWDSITAGAAQNGTMDAWREMEAVAREAGSAANAGDQAAANALYQQLLGNNADGTNNPALETLLDVDNYIDYLIANFYGGNGDWPGRNFYAGRERGPESAGFKFYSWDAEKVLGHEEGATVTANRLGVNTDVAVFYGQLRNVDEFRLRFADRVQQHFFNGGALFVDPEHPEWNPDDARRNVPAARYDELARQVELPLVAELARWGDTSRRSADKLPDGSDRLITPDDWAAFRDGLFADYFPRRSGIVVDQFRSAGLFPNVDAPVFNQHGGVIAADFPLTLVGSGEVYYTTDGSDPRQIGGGVSSRAMRSGGELRLLADATVKARSLTDGEWSALTEATFLIASDFPLRITELNYSPHDANPVPGLAEADVDREQFEFIELTNVGAQTIDLAEVRFVPTDVRGVDQGIQFTFAPQSLGAGDRIVVVRDREAFPSRYGTSVPIAAGDGGEAAGTYGGLLSDTGEQLTLLDPTGQVIQQFVYPAIGRSNGGGSSLEIVDPAASYDDPANWRESSAFGGSPGVSGTGTRSSRIVVNEVLANTDVPATDQVELFNTGAQDADIGGWYLSDADDNYFQTTIATPTRIPGLGYLVLSGDEIGFDLSGAHGGQLWLISADASGRPMRFVDHVVYPPSGHGISLGPWPHREDAFLPLAQTTFGGPNSGPRVGDAIISEVHYAPTDPDGEGGLRVQDFEFIEIYNTTDGPVDLTGWQLTGDVAMDFPEATVMGPGETVVLVGFDPSNTNRSNVFRFTFGVPPNVPLIGRLADPHNRRLSSGVVDDEGALIQLVRPGESTDGSGVVPLRVVDQVHYLPLLPWSESPAGTGDSLTRIRPEDFGPFAISWVGATPTPGRTEFFERFAGDANDDGQFEQADITHVLQSAKYMTGEKAGWSDGDWNGDNLFDQFDVVVALQAGRYGQGPMAARRDASDSIGGDVSSGGDETTIDVAVQEMTGGGSLW